jgi:hypothetical protein
MPWWCVQDECKRQSAFNYKYELKAIYCNEHKLNGMVNVKDKRCMNDNCNWRPIYNIEGESRGIYCKEHKLNGMVDVISKQCMQNECKRRATFNIEGESRAIYCNEHKLNGMVDVRSKRCIYNYCKRQPTFNFEGELRAIYCNDHKLNGMVNVKSKRCAHDNCKRQPTFNIEGESRAIYCKEHKMNGMVDVKSKRCAHDECKRIPTFNYEGESNAIYCNEHKLNGMVNVISKRCKSPWCSTRPSNNKYEGYCLYCFMHLFPDKPILRNYKTKERSVVEHVKSNFPDFEWIADKIVQGGCSRRRPDLLLDLHDQILIVEIDENQHIDYDCSCENKRIMQLSQDLGHVPIVFIRFNPDDYRKNGSNVTSCWGQNKNGFCVVKKSKTREWEMRLNALDESIRYWSAPENKTNKLIEVVQLFYDI